MDNNYTLRDTFGVIDSKTGKIYPDIKDYFLITDLFEPRHLNKGSYYYDTITYVLHKDKKLKRAIMKEGKVRVIISMQRRTDCNIALARIYQNSNNKLYNINNQTNCERATS